jgi:hypothetical protein
LLPRPPICTPAAFKCHQPLCAAAAVCVATFQPFSCYHNIIPMASAFEGAGVRVSSRFKLFYPILTTF